MKPRALMAVWPVALTIGCVAQAPTRHGDDVRELLSQDWTYWMAQSPEAATAFGVAGHDNAWTDYSPEAVAARAAHLRQTLDRLRQVDVAALGEADRLNYDLYKGLIETAIDGLAFDNDPFPIPGVVPHNLAMPVTQMDGVQADIPRIISLMPAATVADYEHIIARLQAAPALIDQTIAQMRQGMAKGKTPPKITMRDVPSQIDGQTVSDAASSPLLSAFKAFPAAIPAAERDRLTSAATGAYASAVKPAFVRLREFLAGTYIPACRDTTAASALPDGAAMYAYNVRWHTTTDATPQQIHELGLSEVKRIRGEMDAIIASVGFKGGFEAFKTYLRTNPAFFYKDADALEDGYRLIAKRADRELAHLFGTLPRTPYGIQRVPDAMAPSQTTAYYEPGAMAAGRPGDMYVNTYKLDARPKWEMEALTLHEAVPGHHLQIALGQELDGLPDFRLNLSYTAFVEGWALYAESLGTDMHFYADPYSKFGQLTYEMWRAVRLVVDTGLHAMNWTRQQAIDYFQANAAKTLQDITVEVDRYIVWPGQALGYKMGQLKIRELRTKAEKTMGARFDVRKFHDVVLGQGAVPMSVLERRVSDWSSK
jgi:uncharacterized protein (DUF885 family)